MSEKVVKKADEAEVAVAVAPAPAADAADAAAPGTEETLRPVRQKPPPPGGATWGTGRRKASVARVRIKAGEGRIVINGRPHVDYFKLIQDRAAIEAVLDRVGSRQKIDVFVNCNGGGPTGQSGAVVMGLARALRKYDAAFEDTLRTSGFLTRDSRMKERKKYGRRGARRGFQFSKR